MSENAPEQVHECHGRLRDYAERRFAANEERRDDEGRDDLDEIVVAGGEEPEVAVHCDGALHVLDQLVDATRQARAEAAFALQHDHRLCVVA
jgi:hypothetical protein